MSDYPTIDPVTLEPRDLAPTTVIDVHHTLIEDDGATGDGGSTTETAKDQAREVGQSAKEAGQHVAGVAKEQTEQVAAEAKNQAKDLLNQGREELRSQATQQQQRLAGGLHSLAQELHAMAEGSDDPGLVSDFAHEAAQRAATAADWLDGREPGALLEEVRSFARQRPGTFLGLSAAAGLLVGRLGRGVKEGAPTPARHAEDGYSA